MQLARDIILVRWAEKEQMEEKSNECGTMRLGDFLFEHYISIWCHLVLSFGYIWALPEMYRKSWVERVRAKSEERKGGKFNEKIGTQHRSTYC
jgi:hypothetical protein